MLSSLSELVNAITTIKSFPKSDENAAKNASVNVELHWPRDRCRLLNDDVVLIDTPGVDVDVEFDEWLKTFGKPCFWPLFLYFRLFNTVDSKRSI